MNTSTSESNKPSQHTTSMDCPNEQLMEQVHPRIVQGDYSGAERLVRQALAADPNSCTARNALVVVMCHTGRRDEAMRLLRETIEIQPSDPSAYYNLATMLAGDNRTEEALPVLEALFAKAQCDCPVEQTVFSHAFTLCRCIRETLADKHHDEACEAVEGFRKSIETLTGYPVAIHFEDLAPNVGAYTETALQRGCGQHDIHCNRRFPAPVQQHFLAHEIMHIQLEAEAHRAGKAKGFVTTGVSPGFKSQFFLPRPHCRQLQKQGWDKDTIARVLANQVDQILLNLLNSPLDLVVENRVRERFPVLASAQFLAMGQLLSGAPEPEEVLNGRGVMPRRLMLIALALNDVKARLYDRMFAHTTSYALSDSDTDVFPLASKLWACWQSTSPSLKPGDEYDLVDQFAEILGLRQGYEWVSRP